MNQPGVPEAVYVAARRTLLHALEILSPDQQSLIVCGVQAVYTLSDAAATPIGPAPFTRDADIALDVRELASQPLIVPLLAEGGFVEDANWPGRYVRGLSDELDGMVAEAQAGPKSRRAAKLSAQPGNVANRVSGVEGILIDNELFRVTSLDALDPRGFEVKVGGPAAMLVAKIWKIAERG